MIGRLEEFAAHVRHGLEEADWLTQREVSRVVVKRVEVQPTQVQVVFRVGPGPPAVKQHANVMQHRGGLDEGTNGARFLCDETFARPIRQAAGRHHGSRRSDFAPRLRPNDSRSSRT